MAIENIPSKATFNRMPAYLKVLREMKKEKRDTVSSVTLAEALGINSSVVKKDLSAVKADDGKPKVGYVIDALIRDIEEFLGYNNTKDAVLVGAGRLGQALLSYKGFEAYGLNIIAGFDVDDRVIGHDVNGKKILPTGTLESIITKLDIKIAVLTVPRERAQIMADILVSCGIRAIWNFTPERLRLPEGIAVKNEDMAASLAVLSGQLREIFNKENQEEK